MNRNYSIIKVFRNKYMGYFTVSIIVVIIQLLCILFIKDLYGKCMITVVLCGCELWETILMIKDVIKISYLFRYGYEIKAIVIGDNYVLTSISTPFYVDSYLAEKVLSPWLSHEQCYIRDGVKYRYEINSEVYESNYDFIYNKETAFVIKGTVINILVNPKNRNDTIIKDIFTKKR
jgi:hypothetical protein